MSRRRNFPYAFRRAACLHRALATNTLAHEARDVLQDSPEKGPMNEIDLEIGAAEPERAHRESSYLSRRASNNTAWYSS